MENENFKTASGLFGRQQATINKIKEETHNSLLDPYDFDYSIIDKYQYYSEDKLLEAIKKFFKMFQFNFVFARDSYEQITSIDFFNDKNMKLNKNDFMIRLYFYHYKGALWFDRICLLYTLDKFNKSSIYKVLMGTPISYKVIDSKSFKYFIKFLCFIFYDEKFKKIMNIFFRNINPYYCYVKDKIFNGSIFLYTPTKKNVSHKILGNLLVCKFAKYFTRFYSGCKADDKNNIDICISEFFKLKN